MSDFSWLRSKTLTHTSRGRSPHGPAARRFRPRLELLESREVPSTLTVTNNLDYATGSLRKEIWYAHSGDTIVFAPGLAHKTITLNWGELDIAKNLTIQGLGANELSISGNRNSRVFDVYPGVQVTLSGLTVNNGNDVGLTSESYPDYGGGGILNLGSLTINSCALSNNTTVYRGGGIANYGTLTVNGSTLARNVDYCDFTGGGGIDNAGGTTTLINCTLVGNWAFSYAHGGAISVEGGTTSTLINCTVVGNVADYGAGGGIGVMNGAVVNLTNTIVAGNTAGTSPDISGAVATADHNLVGNATGSTGIVNGVNGNIVGSRYHVINALLGPLQNNGGPTQTMALLAGSPAIGHADNALAPATDERGVKRLDEAGETTDIGAFEL